LMATAERVRIHVVALINYKLYELPQKALFPVHSFSKPCFNLNK
jgi:hypothetical protein